MERITVCSEEGFISIEASEYTNIVWVTNGTATVTEGAQANTLCLAEFDEAIGTFVRAYLIGPGGVLYVQPFKILRNGETLPREDIPRVFDISIPLRFLSNAIERFTPKYSPPWFFWRLLSQYDPAYHTDFFAWLRAQ